MLVNINYSWSKKLTVKCKEFLFSTVLYMNRYSTMSADNTVAQLNSNNSVQ